MHRGEVMTNKETDKDTNRQTEQYITIIQTNIQNRQKRLNICNMAQK